MLALNNRSQAVFDRSHAPAWERDAVAAPAARRRDAGASLAAFPRRSVGTIKNPGRYVGVAPGENVSDEGLKEQLEALNEELDVLNAQARDLEQIIAANVAGILSE